MVLKKDTTKDHLKEQSKQNKNPPKKYINLTSLKKFNENRGDKYI